MFEKIKNFLSAGPIEVAAGDANGYHPLDADTYAEYNKFRPDGPQKLFCYVPFSNMSFSFEGRVLACAYNQKVEVGHYPEQSIREMWFDSVEGNKLRQHMLQAL